MYREPDFERDRWEGQMCSEERRALYETVMARNPCVVWEVGTCRGGGSTYYIAQALANLGNGGVLITSETNPEFLAYAHDLYGEHGALQHLAPFVRFNFGAACSIYPAMLHAGTPVDMAFLDGEERSLECLYEFAMFRPYMHVGDVVAFHDWNTSKTDHIRPVVENDHDWGLISAAVAFRAFERTGEIYK